MSRPFEMFLRSGAEREFVIPAEIQRKVDDTLKTISPIRSIANVVGVGSSGYRSQFARGENAGEVSPPMGDLFANPAATQAMLADATFEVEEWIADEIAREFAPAESAAFVNGNGVNKPKGFLSYVTAATGDDARAFGTLQHVVSGADGAFADNPEEKLIDLVQALRAPYRQGAVWCMNSATLARIRKFKTSDGAFLWQPSLSAGQPASLLGYPVVEAEDMPDIAANSLSIAFGNFKAGYLIAQRGETQIVRDPYSNKPFVHFYATQRVGGAVNNSEAIKLMKFAEQ